MLRSIRYGEADRILHLYSPTLGRFGAIAKGARKPKSRFGGRLEPFFRLDLVLHEGRSDLMTVTNVATIDGYPRLRSRRRRDQRRRPRLRRGPAPARLGRTQPARLQPALPLPLAARRARPAARDQPRSRRSPSGSSWPWSPDSPPSSPPAPTAARPSTWRGFSGASGRRRLRQLRGGRPSPLTEEAHRFMVEALAKPLIEAPAAEPARPAPGRAGGGRDARAPRPRPAARRGLRRRRRAEDRAHVEATATHSRTASAPGRTSSSPSTRRASYPAERADRRARQPAAHAVPARPRPDRPLEVLPPAEAQDPGLRRPRGRPLPDPAQPHARGLRDRPHRRPRAGAERGPDRGDRARPRPRPPALRPRRRGDPRPLPARPRRAAASSTTSTRCGWSRCSSATAPAST